MKKFLIIIISVCYFSFPLSFAYADTEINNTNFPDKTFLNVVRSYDLDGNNILSTAEIELVTNMNVSSMDIYTLKGIEFFTSLSNLNCSENLITILDLSSNTALRYLNCNNNELRALRALNIKKCVNLLELDCSYNNLDNIDLSDNLLLEKLVCWENGDLKELNLENNSN